MRSSTLLAGTGLIAASVVSALPPIVIKGSKFFYENGTQFFMKGVAYQQEFTGRANNGIRYNDPLADVTACRRDVPLLRELRTNTIRVYAINPEADHTECMKLLDEAGIYVVADLSEPDLSINRDDPKWDDDLYARYTAVIDELQQYDNVLGFFAGNEVTNNKTNTEASAFVKAAVRDMKAYIRDQGYRQLGVGYATNDDTEIRDDLTDYFNCGSNEESVDFWGYNIYSWCGESDIKKSGYSNWVNIYKDYSVPVFFAEYGCNSPGGAEGRKFDDTRALFSDDMTGVFSGGLVYMYHQEDNDYGVVKVKGDKAERMDNFFELKKAHKAVDPKGVDEDDYTPKGDREECPEIGKVWRANTRLPPTPEPELCKCAVAKSECAVGDDVKEKDFGEIFDYICDAKGELCTAIQGNGTTGIYGAYSMCDNRSKLTILLGLYYEEQNGAADACDFKGLAEVKKSSAKSSCDEALESASKVNEEAATATGPMSEGTGGADDEDFGVIGTPMARLFSIGDMAVGLYMVVALGVGATMVVL